jgi:hypothetical protein
VGGTTAPTDGARLAADGEDRFVLQPPVTLPDTALGERIRAIVVSLVEERRQLREASAGVLELEANRLAIVYWQQELARLDAERSSIERAPNG